MSRCCTSLARARAPRDLLFFRPHFRQKSHLSLFLFASLFLWPFTARHHHHASSSFSPKRDYYFRLKCLWRANSRLAPTAANIVTVFPKSPPGGGALFVFPESSDRSRGKSNFSFDQNSFQSRADLDLSHPLDFTSPRVRTYNLLVVICARIDTDRNYRSDFELFAIGFRSFSILVQQLVMQRRIRENRVFAARAA